MEGCSPDGEARELFIGDLRALGVALPVDLATNPKPGLRPRRGDRVDDDRKTRKRSASPVLADEREEPVLDLVPLAGPWRKVADGDGQPGFVRQPRELPFPQTAPRRIAPAGVRRDQQGTCAGIRSPAHGSPPPADAVDGERRRIVVDADAHPACISGQVIDAIRDRLALRLDQEVMDPNPAGLALREPLPPGVLEVSDQLLFLCVDRDDRLSRSLLSPDLRVDVLELGVAIRMVTPFLDLLIGLKTVTRLHQERSDRRVADGMAHRLKLPGQCAEALAGPTQRRLGISSGRRLHESVEICCKPRFHRKRALAPRSGPPNPLRPHSPPAAADLLESASDRRNRQPRGASDLRHSAVSERPGLGRHGQAPTPLVQCRQNGCELPFKCVDVRSLSDDSTCVSYFLTDPNQYWRFDFGVFRRRLPDLQQVLLKDFMSSHVICELLDPTPDPQVLRILLSKKCSSGPYRASWRVMKHPQLDELKQIFQMLGNEVKAKAAGKSGPIGLSSEDIDELLAVYASSRGLKASELFSASVDEVKKRRDEILSEIRGKSLSEFQSMLSALKTSEPRDREHAASLIYGICAELKIECPHRLPPEERRTWKTFRAKERFEGDRESFEWVEAGRRAILAPEHRDKLAQILQR
jgi:hypothetical protein